MRHSDEDLIVASYNIHKGVGTDRRRDLVRTARVIAELDADIVALQEADRRFGDRAGLLDLPALQAEAGLVSVPVQGIRDAHGWHGNLILVREAVVEMVEQIALPGLEPRGSLLVDLRIKGQALRVISAHLGLLRSSRRAQARMLMERIAGLDARPTLLMGDLNEWREGKGSSLVALHDHFVPAPAVRSFPARRPLLALDRLMACTQGELHDVSVHHSALARIASDHLPIKALLRLPQSTGA